MTDYKPSLEPNFEAALSREEMEDGELRHLNIEDHRKIAMFAGLTHSSNELEALFSTNPKAFHEALKVGIESIDHYQNIVMLLENAILRIHSVAANHSEWSDGEDIKTLEIKILELLSKNTSDYEH